MTRRGLRSVGATVVAAVLLMVLWTGGAISGTADYVSIADDALTLDNVISVSDAEGMPGNAVTATIAEPNVLSVEAMASQPGETDTLRVALENEAPVSGLQFDLVLPSVLSLDVEDISLTDRATDHSLSVERLSTGTVRVLAFSSNLDAFEGEGGPVVQVPVEVGTAEGTSVADLEGTVLSDTTGKDVTTDHAGGAVVVDSSLPAVLGSEEVEATGTIPVGATAVAAEIGTVVDPGLLAVQRFDTPPSGTPGIEEENVSQYRWVMDPLGGLAVGAPTRLRFALEALPQPGIEDPASVVVYRRETEGTGSFAPLETSYDAETGEIVAEGLSGFSEFVFASDTDPLPVELADFKTTVDEGKIQLTWRTASEQNNVGFRVQRKSAQRRGGESVWTTVGFVEGAGTTSQPQSYRLADDDLPYEADTLTYRLKQVDADGSIHSLEEVTVERSAPELELLGIYPNPVQQRATIRYALSEKQEATIHLYDVLGQRVQTVLNRKQEGRNQRTLDVSTLPSGVYFLWLRADGQTRTQKLTVVQ